MKEVKGNLDGKGKKIGIVISQFNEFITRELLEGCVDELKKHGVEEKDIVVYWVPGSFEIPTTLAKVCEHKKFDVLVALGVIVRGDTPHFDLVSSQVTKGIANLSLTKKVPIIWGVVVADTIEQAIERAGTKRGNRGRDAALSAIEMANLFAQIEAG